MTPLALGPVFGAGPVPAPSAAPQAPPVTAEEAAESLDGASIVAQLPPDVVAVMIGAVLVALVAWSIAMRFKLGRRPEPENARPKPAPAALVAQADHVPLVRGLPDDFSTVALLEDVAEVFRAAHQDRSSRHPRLAEAAHEAVTASAPGFDEVVAVHLGAVRLIRAEGGVDGATAVVELRALIDELRAGAPHATEVCEQWRVVRRPDSPWRVQGVDRVWRRPLAAPSLPPEPEPRRIPPSPDAAAFALAEPQASSRAAASVRAAWSALEAGDVLVLAGVSALALEELATRAELGRRAGVRWRCRPTDPRVEVVHVTRQGDTWLLTCHLSGRARCWLEGFDGVTIAGAPDADRPLDEIWTFLWRDQELVLLHPG